ncbi:MBL fold metallo-hydrolase [Streptomyces sp. NPDC058864]
MAPPRTDYPRRLAEAGFPPHSVDLVILTHLHTDHVGRNTRDEWEHWADTDLDDLADVTGARGGGPRNPSPAGARHPPGQAVVEQRGTGRSAPVTGRQLPPPRADRRPRDHQHRRLRPGWGRTPAAHTRRAPLGGHAGTDTGTVVAWEDGHRLLPEPSGHLTRRTSPGVTRRRPAPQDAARAGVGGGTGARAPPLPWMGAA